MSVTAPRSIPRCCSTGFTPATICWTPPTAIAGSRRVTGELQHLAHHRADAPARHADHRQELRGVVAERELEEPEGALRLTNGDLEGWDQASLLRRLVSPRREARAFRGPRIRGRVRAGAHSGRPTGHEGGRAA